MNKNIKDSLKDLKNYIPEDFQKRAQDLAKNPKELFLLISKADKKAHSKKTRKAFDGLWEDLKALFRLIKAWATLDYNNVQWQTVILGIMGILYFITPLDAVIDYLPFGLVDDAFVLTYIFSVIRSELEEFKAWEETKE